MAIVPEWLFILRLSLGSLTLLVTILYPVLTTPENRDRHVALLKQFMGELRDVRVANVRVLQHIADFVVHAFERLYGRSVRMILVSSILSILYILVAGMVNATWLASLPSKTNEKREFDQSVDTTRRYSRTQIERAHEIRGRRVGPDDILHEYIHHDPEALAIRRAVGENEENWFRALQQRPDAEEIAFLTLLYGFSWDPGPRWFAIAGLLAFNVIFDLLVLVVVRYLLGWLSAASNMRSCMRAYASIVGVTIIFYTISLILSAYFVRGYLSVFSLLLFVLPLIALYPIACLIGIVMNLWELVVNGGWTRESESFLAVFLRVLFVAFIWIGFIVAIQEMLPIPEWDISVIGYPKGKGTLPYVLASCAVAPGLLSVASMVAAAGARVIGPIVIVPIEWYLKSVIETASRMIGIGLLVIPTLVIELAYRVCEWIVKYPDSRILRYFGL